eukprot:symbB.v1.2.011275.t1/scaffold753.1/size277516/11
MFRVKAGQYQAWIKQHDVATAQHLHQLRRSRAKRAKCLQDDQAAHLSQLAAQQFDDLSEAKGTELWKKLRFQLPKFRNKLKKPVPHQQAHDQFLTHFANIEDAAIVSISDLEVKSHDCSGKGIQAAIRIEMTAVDLPSIFELEDAIRAVASKKSSLGSFPIELMKADPSAAAEILLPLMMDFFRHFQQPITWKGGSYYPLFKGKGNYSIPNNYRAILIAYAVPKLFHRIVRARLAQTVAPQLMPFQIGGVKRMSVHFAVQFLNALRLRADILKKPSAVIFFDLRSAFYRAQRSTIVGDVLQYGRADDEDITLDQLTRKPALEDMGVPLPSVLKQFMEQADNILPSLAVDELTQPVPAITWVDDVAIFLQADTVEALVEKATEAVKLMHQKCRSHGLDLNYAKGKTEIMFKFHGKDAVQWRKKLHLQPTMDLGSGYWSHIEVPITTKYTHLGVVHSAKATHDAELNYRLGRARAAMQECMKPVLRQRAIPAQTRWQLAKSLILSRLFFAAELWPTLSASQAAKVYNFMMKIARIILNMENFVGMDHYTDQHVEAHIQIPALATLLRAARLRHLARMWHLGPDALRRLLLQLEMVDGDAWMRRAWEDVAWLQQRVPNLRHMTDPLVDRHQWVIRMGSFKEWYSMIGQAVQADTQYRHYMAKHQLWKGRLQQQLEHVGLKFEMQQPEPEFQPHQCNLCEAKFATYKALSVHMYKQHQQHARERQYMEGTVCLSCLKEFHSTQRLRQHLQWKPDGCLRHLQETLWPFPHNDVPIKEMLRTAHRVPTFRLEGPEMLSRQAWIEAKPDKEFPPLPEAIPEPPGPRPQHEDEHEAPSQSTAEMVKDGNLALLVEAALTEKATWEPPLVHWWSTAPAFATLKEFATILQDDLVHRVDFTWYYDIFQWVETTLAEHFSIRRRPMDCEEPARNGHAHYRKQSSSTDPKVSYSYTHVERALPGTAATHYILYAYAGHRREGDMVEWAEKFSAQTGLQIAVVTLDIVYHSQLCNLRNPDAQSKWCKHMEERRFIAAIGAPPCETWSVARMQAWILQDGGPPPLRTRQEPWGLAELSAKQQAQVDCANDLMHIWLLFLVLAVKTRTPCLMEHPAPSWRYEDAASIWRTAEMQWIKMIRMVEEVLVIQGLYGAASTKPTYMMVFDLPHFKACLAKWKNRCTNVKKWIALQGKGADGSYLTAQAKAYPPHLNAAILESIVLGLAVPDAVKMSPPPESFLADANAVIHAQQVLEGQAVGIDLDVLEFPEPEFVMRLCVCGVEGLDVTKDASKGCAWSCYSDHLSSYVMLQLGARNCQTPAIRSHEDEGWFDLLVYTADQHVNLEVFCQDMTYQDVRLGSVEGLTVQKLVQRPQEKWPLRRNGDDDPVDSMSVELSAKFFFLSPSSEFVPAGKGNAQTQAFLFVHLRSCRGIKEDFCEGARIRFKLGDEDVLSKSSFYHPMVDDTAIATPTQKMVEHLWETSDLPEKEIMKSIVEITGLSPEEVSSIVYSRPTFTMRWGQFVAISVNDVDTMSLQINLELHDMPGVGYAKLEEALTSDCFLDTTEDWVLDQPLTLKPDLHVSGNRILHSDEIELNARFKLRCVSMRSNSKR